MEHLAKMDLLVRMVPRVNLEEKALLVWLEHLAKLDLVDCLATKEAGVSLVSWGLRERLANRGKEGSKVYQAPLVLLEMLGHKETQEFQVQLGNQGQQEQLVREAHLDHKEFKASLDLLVFLESWE